MDKNRIEIYLTDEQVKWADQRAEAEGRSRKNLLEHIVIEDLKLLPHEQMQLDVIRKSFAK